MKSLGERLLELRERYVESGCVFRFASFADDEWLAVFGDQDGPEYPRHIKNRIMRYTVAIERAAVRELKKEGKL